jgi:hypothetical protein
MAVTNLKEFQRGLNKFIPHVKGITEDEIRKGLFGVTLRGLVFKTPIDKGVARGNWNTEFNKKNTSTNKDARAIDGITKGKSKLKRFKLGQTVYFTNALPYIVPLEFGHSKQAQNGMMRRTFQETINYFRKEKGRV